VRELRNFYSSPNIIQGGRERRSIQHAWERKPEGTTLGKHRHNREDIILINLNVVLRECQRKLPNCKIKFYNSAMNHQFVIPSVEARFLLQLLNVKDDIKEAFIFTITSEKY
jgi:hypothetical protein